MFWSRDFSSDDNRDPVYLHASNTATRDVRDDEENAQARNALGCSCKTYMIHVLNKLDFVTKG